MTFFDLWKDQMTYLPPKMKSLGQDVHFDLYVVNFLAYKKIQSH